MKATAGQFTPQKRRSSLQLRLTAFTLAISISMIVGLTLLLSAQARKELVGTAVATLNNANQSVNKSLNMWLDYNTKALYSFVSNPDVISMNSLWQKPLVEEMAANYPYMFLVATTDVNGVNKVRSDGQPVISNKDRFWFQNALKGASITYEIQIGEELNQPTLVVSMPIMNATRQIVGVGMFAAHLDQAFDFVKGIRLDEGGSAFIVDQHNVLMAHSNPNSPVLSNYIGHPAVKALRQGQSGEITYLDSQGVRTHAVISRLGNDWGVVVQQTEAGLFQPIYDFQKRAFTALLIGGLLMFVLIWQVISISLRPVHELTATATAISQGDLTRQARVERNDELGLLAKTFNQMTEQLRNLIQSLETRVAERTQSLERRAVQFQVTSEVAREAAAIQSPEKLLKDVASLIPDRFGFDHTGIFLIEKMDAPETTSDSSNSTEDFAVLRAASSEGGQRMLKRGHRLKVGQQGIVGYVASTGLPRIALDVGQDAVFFNNPDLPLTRSEMALPLKIQNKVIGVLDVQSNLPSAFKDDDIAILQIMADQLALAIENTRLLSESQHAFQELEKAYGLHVRAGWNKRLSNKPLTVRFARKENNRPIRIDTGAAEQQREAKAGDTASEMITPIELRGHQIGILRLRRAGEEEAWTSSEKDLIRETVNQLALSLENARLLEEIRERATQETLINQVVTKTQSSLNLETVMRTAVKELASLAPLSRIRIRLRTDKNGGNGRRDKQLETPGYNPAQEKS